MKQELVALLEKTKTALTHIEERMWRIEQSETFSPSQSKERAYDILARRYAKLFDVYVGLKKIVSDINL